MLTPAAVIITYLSLHIPAFVQGLLGKGGFPWEEDQRVSGEMTFYGYVKLSKENERKCLNDAGF